MKRGVGLLLAAMAAAGRATPGSAQSWRLRFDGSAQRVAFRGVTADSVPESATSAGPTGGPVTSDGYAATCFPDGFCRFYRPGPLLRGVPASAGTDLTLWGLGVTGLSVRINARTITDLTGDRLWPGTSPTFRLVEGYGEYVRGGLTARLGRMLEESRLGSAGTGGLDGLRATYRFAGSGLVLGGYAGWGLARGTTLSVTSPAVDPLAEFQPGHRQVVAGALAGIRWRTVQADAEYRREVDPFTDYFVSERAALSLLARPVSGFRVALGSDYDLAQGRWGSADATIAYTGKSVWATAAARHYRPFFDLWTVWGVFSPVPYNGVSGSLTVNPAARVQVRGRGEWFRYDAADVSAPAVTLENSGWRWGLEATVTPALRWTVEAGGHGEFQPGASSRGIDGRVTWRPRETLDLALSGGSLERPLELRFQDAGVTWAGGAASWHDGTRWSVGLTLDRYWESRDRPDAASFDWNQWRMSARVSLTLRSGADRWVLPPARPREVVP